MKVERKCTKLKTFRAGEEHSCGNIIRHGSVVVHEALACPACLGLSQHYSCENCRRGHCSPLEWTGLAAEGEIDPFTGSSGFLD